MPSFVAAAPITISVRVWGDDKTRQRLQAPRRASPSPSPADQRAAYGLRGVSDRQPLRVIRVKQTDTEQLEWMVDDAGIQRDSRQREFADPHRYAGCEGSGVFRLAERSCGAAAPGGSNSQG